MESIQSTLNNAQKQTKKVARQQKPLIENITRLGYFAKGVVYIVIGFLAVEAAFLGQGRTTDSRGALENMSQQPFGRFLLACVAVGLAGYAFWRLIQAGLDTENKGNDAKGIVARLGYLLSATAYGTLSYSAFQILTGNPVDRNSTAQDWTARIMAHPFGNLLVGLVAMIVVGVGVGQIVKGWKTDFTDKLSLSQVNGTQKNLILQMGRWGYIARGIVFAILGGFVVEAAMHVNPQQVKGLGSALDLLAIQPYGFLLLGIVAAGLMAYGAFMLVVARWRRVEI